MTSFQTNEKYLSQIPALCLLIKLGYEFIEPGEALRERGGRLSNVILEQVLRDQLKEINRIRHKGKEYLFSEENIQSAVQRIKNVRYDGLQKTNEVIYDLLTLGTALEQNVEYDLKSFNLNYIDWRHPERNRFHVSVEYAVERSRSVETARPDIVLFVNGIPFCVIECKAPGVEVEQAVSQSIRNQSDEYIPRLFVYSQMLLAVNKNKALYATCGTAAKFWSLWNEGDLSDGSKEYKKLEQVVAEPLDEAVIRSISEVFSVKAESFIRERLVTEQDAVLYALCRPERLLELAWKFTVFDGGIKKIARYQQYFVIKSTLERVKRASGANRSTEDKSREGGII
jgi:type I restriction enzyme, R subunit